KTHQKTDAICSPFDIAADSAGGAIEMKCQLQLMQVPENFQANAPHGMFGNAAEQRIAQFAEKYTAKTQQAVKQDKCQRQNNLWLQTAIDSVNDMVQRPGH